MNPVRYIMAALALLTSTMQTVAQAPSWTQPVQYPYALGGESGREGPAAVFFNNNVRMVFTSRNPTPNGGYYIFEATSSDGLNYSSPSTIYTSGVPANAASNPSLAINNGVLYLAYNNAGGTQLLSSTDGTNWSFIEQLPTGVAVTSSPGIASYNNMLYNRTQAKCQLWSFRSGSMYLYTNEWFILLVK